VATAVVFDTEVRGAINVDCLTSPTPTILDALATTFASRRIRRMMRNSESLLRPKLSFTIWQPARRTAARNSV
jgi:hypothetical protein